MTQTSKARLLMLFAIIYFIAPDLIPGPIDDVVLTFIAALNLHNAKQIED